MNKKLQIRGSVEKVAGQENKYRVLASTASIDRQGDSIDQSGWQLANYFKNPVMLWAHDYSELPIAKATKVEVTSKGLEMEFEFISPEGNPKGAQVKYCYDNGFLNAVSVGFMCLERNGNIITRAELFEVSFVPVPANAEALRLALNDTAIDFSLIKKQLEKGEVSDQLSAEQAMEAKWKNCEQVFDILGAFYDVYFDEATPVEDFGALLSETLGLLKDIIPAGNETVTDGIVKLAIKKGVVAKFADAVYLKEGRTLSSKTLTKINDATAAMKTATEHLDTLVKESSKDTEDKSAVVPPVVAKEGTLNLLEAVMLGVQGQLRANDKQNETTLKLVNDVIAEFQKSKAK